MKIIVVSTVIALFACIVHAETHLMGDISQVSFNVSGNPFIVEQEISVPALKSVVIQKGCIFLFKPFTGMNIEGSLFVEGTAEQPVVFTSINDNEFNKQSDRLPNPFDWNGVIISHEASKVSFTCIELRFSVYGVKSNKKDAVMNNCLFRKNGQFHYTVNDVVQLVQDDIPFSTQQLNAEDVKENDESISGENSKDRQSGELSRENSEVDSLITDGRTYKASKRKRTVLFQGSLNFYNLISDGYSIGGVLDVGAKFGKNFIGASLGGCTEGPATGVKYYYEIKTYSSYISIDAGAETGWYVDFNADPEKHFFIGPGVQLKIGKAPVLLVFQNHVLIGDAVADHINVGIMLRM